MLELGERDAAGPLESRLWTHTEQRVAAAFKDELEADLSSVEDRTVDARVIRQLLTQDKDALPSSPVLRLTGAHIVGRLDLSALNLSASIQFDRCNFDAKPIFNEAHIETLRLKGCVVPGLSATNFETSGDIEFNDGFISTGPINLQGARIGGLLRMTGARVVGVDDEAINLARARIGGGFFAAHAIITGQLRLVSCRIAGTLSLKDSSFTNRGDRAINAQRCSVEESVLLQRAKFAGRVHLMNATIDGGFDAQDAMFEAEGEVCLNLTRVTAARNITFKNASIVGKVQLSAASGANISFTKTRFARDAELDMRYLNARRLLLRFGTPPALLDLTGANTDDLQDACATWPEKIVLERCAYSHIDALEHEGDAKTRLRWIEGGAGQNYEPAMYEQLIKHYVEKGDESGARKVSIAKLRARRRTQPLPAKAFGCFLDITVGYGYRNWLAVFWIIALTLTGTWVYSTWRPLAISATNPTPFQPFLYTLDQLLPILDVGQDRAFAAVPPVQWFGTLLALSGWALSVAVVAGVTKLFNRP